MTFRSYWQIDAAAEPQRAEPALRHPLPSLINDRRTGSQNRYDYYAQLAQAASQTGFDGVYLPYRRDADESRIVAAVIARAAPRIALVPEFPASVGSAVYAAKQATTFQRSTGGRLGWAIAPDADTVTRAAEGDVTGEEELDNRIEEFLTVARGVHEQRPFSFAGQHFEVQNGGFEEPLNRYAFPTVFLSGDSEEALSLSARHADVHLFDAAPLDRLSVLIEQLDNLASHAGRSVAFGLRQPLLVRETQEEADHAASQSNPAPGTLIGSFDSVAEALASLARLGITHFLFSGSPSLEESYRVGQHLLPRFHALASAQRAVA